MKKRIFMLLMTVVMILGMSFTSMADEVKYYEGTGECVFDPYESNIYSLSNVKLEYSSEYMLFSFVADGVNHTLLLTPIAGSGSGPIQCDAVYDGVNKGSYNDYYDVFSLNNNTVTWIKIGVGDVYISGSLNLVEVSTEPPIYQISTGFTGTAVSDRGDYNLYIAGYFRKDLTNGTHALVLNDITSQTIAVVAHNNANGVNRNMNQSTIEEITVTVSGGVVTEMIIRGRVQTDGGTLDRYTATINP